jgi:hypothetical protein
MYATLWDVLKIRVPSDVTYFLNVTGKSQASDVVATAIYVTAGVVSLWLAGRWLLKRHYK